MFGRSTVIEVEEVDRRNDECDDGHGHGGGLTEGLFKLGRVRKVPPNAVDPSEYDTG